MTDLRIRLAPTTRLIGAALLAAAALAPSAHAADPAPQPAAGKAAPAEEPSTLILSDTLHYDDVKKQSVFTGNVNMTRGLMTLTSDTLEMHEDAKGNQYGTATANKGKVVTIRQERPENFELIEGKGLRAEYDGTNSTFDLIGQAVVVRYVCGKPFDTIRGERVRYNEKSGTYEAHGGPNSAAAGGRVRSVAEPRARRTPPSPNAASSRPRRRGAKRLPATHPPPRMNPPSVQTPVTSAPSGVKQGSLRATGLRKTYNGRTVVQDVSPSVSSGEVVGLLGPNGAGKTTSFYMIVGLVPADAGRIEIDGDAITAMPIHKRARMGLSYLPQDASVFRRLTVEQNIRAVLELQLGPDGKPCPRPRSTSRWNRCWRNCRSATSAATRPSRCRAANAAAWKSRARWPPARASSCWTNPSPAWTPSR